MSVKPASEPRRWIKLNQFQRMMLRWNDLHPYNAVHCVRVRAALDLDRLKSAISTTLQSISFGQIVLNATANPSSSTHFDAQNVIVPLPEISIVPPNGALALYWQIERELNRPFLCGPRINPFRFFAQTNEKTFWLGLTYFHPVADAEAIAWLLKACIDVYAGRVRLPPPGSCRPSSNSEGFEGPPLDLCLGVPDPPLVFRHPFVVLHRLTAIATTAAAMRRCFRPPIRNHNDFTNGFVFFSIPAQELRTLIATSKSWSVTVNDVFLALLLRSISPLASHRHTSSKRRRLGIGCIVNLRKDLGSPARPVFGLFLGSFVLTHEAPDTLSLETLAREVNRQTAKIKARRLALGTPVELVFGRLLFSFFSTERQKKLYQKNYPLWGGVTNMNLNSMWPQSDDPSSSIDYFRAVTTGPATPLVLSITTCGDHLNVGLTFRTTVYSDSDVAQFKTTFQDHVAQLRPKT